MRNISKLIGLLLVLAVLFSSCGIFIAVPPPDISVSDEPGQTDGVDNKSPDPTESTGPMQTTFPPSSEQPEGSQAPSYEPTEGPADIGLPEDTPGSTEKPVESPYPTDAPTATLSPTTKPTSQPTATPTAKPTSSPTQTPKPTQPPEQLLELKYFRSKLSANDRAIYDAIYEAVDQYRLSLDLSKYSIDREKFSDIWDAYTSDSPEHYWAGVKEIVYSSVSFKVVFQYTVSKADKAKYDKIVSEKTAAVLNGMGTGLSEYEKVKYIHDYMVLNTEYDLDSEHNQNILSVFIHGSSVCAGYARTTQYLLNKAGIQCIYVTGQADNGSGSGYIPHAWNIVKVGGKYYNLDTTWDDPVFTPGNGTIDYSRHISYEFFLITDEQLSKTHDRDPVPVSLPACTSTESNYYVRESLLFSRFGEDEIRKLADFISRNIKDRPQFLYFKFTGKDAYDAFRSKPLGENYVKIVDATNDKLGSNVLDKSRCVYLEPKGDSYIFCYILLYK